MILGHSIDIKGKISVLLSFVSLVLSKRVLVCRSFTTLVRIWDR